jgi:Ca-activated chloride channel homolog
LASYFQAVTPRTAGFNSSISQICTGHIVFYYFADVYWSFTRVDRGRDQNNDLCLDPTCGMGDDSRIQKRFYLPPPDPVEQIYKALTITVAALTLVIVDTMALTITEHADILTAMFESVPAFGTVGLTGFDSYPGDGFQTSDHLNHVRREIGSNHHCLCDCAQPAAAALSLPGRKTVNRMRRRNENCRKIVNRFADRMLSNEYSSSKLKSNWYTYRYRRYTLTKKTDSEGGLMQKRKFHFLLIGMLVAAAFSLSGCSPVLQQIKQTAGSQIDKPDELNRLDQLAVKDNQSTTEEREIEKDDLPQSPAPHTDLLDILADRGEGEYAGDEYNQSKVMKALKQMPKGLSDDKAYAYLLGLVGENYKKDVQFFDELSKTSYKEKVDAWQEVADRWKPKTTQKPGLKPTALLKNPLVAPVHPKKINFVILLDTSKSMDGKMDGKTKMDYAKAAIQKFADSLPKETTAFQLRVYGNQGSAKEEDKSLSCQSTAKLISGEGLDDDKWKEVVDKIKPIGYTPMALAILTSKQDMMPGAPTQAENQVIIVSDGYENCGGDPVQAAKELHLSDALANVHVIGIDVDPETEAKLRQVTDVTGGDYMTVSGPAQLDQAFKERILSLKLADSPWQMRALDTIMKEHSLDENRLEQFHDQLLGKIEREYNRLDKANRFVEETGKVDTETFDTINNWIHERKSQLEDYSDRRQQEIGIELDQDWRKQASALLEDWSKEGGEKTEIIQNANQLLQNDLLKNQMDLYKLKQNQANEDSK